MLKQLYYLDNKLDVIFQHSEQYVAYFERNFGFLAILKRYRYNAKHKLEFVKRTVGEILNQNNSTFSMEISDN